MSDEQQPPEKPTVQFEKVPAWAIALKESVDGGFKELRGDISLVANDVSLVKERVAIVEGRISQVEGRQDSNSMRAKEMSGVDLKHDAAIAEIKTDVAHIKESMATKEDLKTNTEATLALKKQLVDDVKGFLKTHPELVKVAVSFVTTAITAATVWLAARGH